VNLLLIGAIAATLQSRQRLQTSLDRRFFREAYHQEQVLVQLIDEVRQRDSLADIARLVSARIDSVLHPTTLHIFYRAAERSERFERHSSSDVLAPPQLSEQRGFLALIGNGAAIREFPSDFENRLPDSERGWLEQLGVRVIVPNYRRSRTAGRRPASRPANVGRALFRDGPAAAAGHRGADRPRVRESACRNGCGWTPTPVARSSRGSTSAA
jgi:hypothetical protein